MFLEKEAEKNRDASKVTALETPKKEVHYPYSRPLRDEQNSHFPSFVSNIKYSRYFCWEMKILAPI